MSFYDRICHRFVLIISDDHCFLYYVQPRLLLLRLPNHHRKVKELHQLLLVLAYWNVVAGEEYIILKCADNYKLSRRVSREFPDFVLIRQCSLDIIALIQAKTASVGRFLITGTPGVGKTVSVIVWLYLALKGELKITFKHIIVDLKATCMLLSQTGMGL